MMMPPMQKMAAPLALASALCHVATVAVQGGDEGQGGEQAGRHGVQGVLLCRDLVLL